MTGPSAAENAHLQFILSVLSHAGPIAVNWSKVADEHGIGYARNGGSKFKDILKKYGYKFEKNTVKKADDDGDGDMDGKAVAIPPTPAAKKGKKGTGTSQPAKSAARKPLAKKRKLVDVEDDDDVDGDDSNADGDEET